MNAPENTPGRAVSDRTVPDRTVLNRLATEPNVWLSTVRPDGSPHTTPVWFVHLRDRWWVGTDSGTVKVRNTARNPHVSLALEDGRYPVVAEGEVAGLARPPFPRDVVEAFRAKYDWDVTAVHRAGNHRLLMEIRVRRWLMLGAAP